LRTLNLLVLAVSVLGTEYSVLSAADPIDFKRDVQPIFAKACLSCHGAERQKSSFRLDRKADALAGGDLGKAIVPGKSADSPLVRYVSGTDRDLVMPPDAKKRLTKEEIATLRKWIDEGAKWPDDGSAAATETWWSLKPLGKRPIPTSHDREGAAWIKTPVDAFVLAKLREKGLKPSPEADRRTLIRRVYFDLIGLPPTYEDVERFATDPAPDAYEKLIDKLLASPQYGERWARHWLDVVHYGETHGYDKDKPRPNAWPYRDYVIRSFNADKPYSRFVQEQVAGDVLFPGTRDGVEALGFIAVGPWDFIGHAELPETKIDGKVARHLDRDDMIANTIGTFQSLTVHCAQCHNHKFDPIPQADYYKLQAVFAALDRADKAYDLDPATAKRRQTLQAKLTGARAELAKLEADAAKKAGPELAALDQQIQDGTKGGGPGMRAEFGYHSGIEARQDRVKWVQVDLGRVTAITQIVLRPCFDDFNNIGAGFGFPVRYKVELSDDPTFRTGVTAADHTSGDVPNPGTATTTFDLKDAKARYVRVTATKLAPRQNEFIFALAELEVLGPEGKSLSAGGTVTALDSIEAPPRWRKSNLIDGIHPPSSAASPEQLAALKAKRDALWDRAVGVELGRQITQARKAVSDGEQELRQLPPQRHVYAGTVHTGSGTFVGTGANGGKPRPIHILPRGDVTKPGAEVSPGALTALPELQASFNLSANHAEGDRRAALAKWLTDPRNPLTWRSIVNRVWLYHFGRGIVDTPNDFGRMGQLPTHPELLDWLAAEFRDNGQSLKQLHRLVVTSSVYRQSAAPDANAEKVDASNAYYWRSTRRKLEAEAVRDSILAVAGKLDATMYGPSFQDFKIEKPEHSPHYQYHLHDADDPKSHRRSVYRFVVRSKPQPWLAALDCADPSQAVDKRNQTITAQQALALLNNQLTGVMAKHFAARAEKLGDDARARVVAAFRLALSRSPTGDEADALTAYAEKHGLANACRVLVNLNEFAFVD
jgi:mono/diheme cytochrome c family protein